MTLSKREWKGIADIIVIILIIGAISYFASHSIALQDFKNYVNSFGRLAPIVLLIIIIISSSIGFVFALPVAVSALVLDVYSAFIVSLAGLTIGAMISFFVSRKIGREYISKRYIHKIKLLEDYDNHLRKKGFLTIFFLRLISLMPYELVNIGAGFSRIEFWPFFFGTILGIIPGTLITIYFVRSTSFIGSTQFVVATTILTLFAVLPLLFKRVRKIVFALN